MMMNIRICSKTNEKTHNILNIKYQNDTVGKRNQFNKTLYLYLFASRHLHIIDFLLGSKHNTFKY